MIANNQEKQDRFICLILSGVSVQCSLDMQGKNIRTARECVLGEAVYFTTARQPGGREALCPCLLFSIQAPRVWDSATHLPAYQMVPLTPHPIRSCHPHPQPIGWCHPHPWSIGRYHTHPSLLEGSIYIQDMSSPLFLKPRSQIAPGMYFRNHLAVLTQASWRHSFSS